MESIAIWWLHGIEAFQVGIGDMEPTGILWLYSKKVLQGSLGTSTSASRQLIAV